MWDDARKDTIWFDGCGRRAVVHRSFPASSLVAVSVDPAADVEISTPTICERHRVENEQQGRLKTPSRLHTSPCFATIANHAHARVDGTPLQRGAG